MRTCPCRGCVPPQRSATCHATCNDYIEWDKEKEEKNRVIHENKEKANLLWQGTRRRKW